MIDIQLRTQTRTHLQHPCQTAQEGLQERVDRLDLHIVIIQQHLLKALSRTPTEHLVRRTLIADHEFPRITQEVLRPAFSDLMQIADDALAHLRRRLVGKSDRKDRAVVLARKQ